MKKKLLNWLLPLYLASTSCMSPKTINSSLTTRHIQEIGMKQSELTTKEHEETRKYALIINGDSSQIHRKNVAEAYKSLKYLGFEDEKIIILTNTCPDYSRRGDIITKSANIETLTSTMHDLSKRVNNIDLLLIYTTGHGLREDNQPTLRLGFKPYPPSQLESLLKSLNAGKIVLIADQCYSGGFTKFFSELDIESFVLTSTDSNSIAIDCHKFSRPFWRSFRHPRKADLDRDGKVSLDEAKSYALRKYGKYGIKSCGYQSKNPPKFLN